MGKAKKTKTKKPPNRVNRVLPKQDSEEEGEFTMEPLDSELAVLAAKEQLQSSNFEEKLCGLQTLSTFLESYNYATLIVKLSVIRVAAPLLLDDYPTVRNATAGTLRNFSTLGLDACDYLTEQDVMTPLLAFFHKYTENWIPKQTKTEKLDEDGDTFLHSVHLLWNLCESSGTAVKYVNDSGTIPILARCIDTETFGNDMVASVLHCIFVIIEDNPQASLEFKSTYAEAIKKIFFSEESAPIDLLLRVLSAGIILNTHSENMSLLPSDIVYKIMSTLSVSLSADLRQECNRISSSLPLADGNTDPAKHKESADVQKEIGILRHLVDAQQTALEIMTNICSCEERDEDADCVSDADSEIDDKNLSSCSAPDGDASYIFDKLPIEVIESITTHGLVAQIRSKILLPADNVVEIFQDSEDGIHIYRRLCIIRNGALLCLNNMVANLPIENLGGFKEIYNIWVEMGLLIFKNFDMKDEMMLEPATAVMRTALDRFKLIFKSPADEASVDTDLFNTLSSQDVLTMLNGIRRCRCPERRAILIRMVGTLASILTQNLSMNYNDILKISQFILDQLPIETECWAIAEIFDTVMDVFSEDETDSIAAEINLDEKLAMFAPLFIKKAKNQKKSLGDHAPLISTVMTNLPRFMKYRKYKLVKIDLILKKTKI